MKFGWVFASVAPISPINKAPQMVRMVRAQTLFIVFHFGTAQFMLLVIDAYVIFFVKCFSILKDYCFGKAIVTCAVKFFMCKGRVFAIMEGGSIPRRRSFAGH